MNAFASDRIKKKRNEQNFHRTAIDKRQQTDGYLILNAQSTKMEVTTVISHDNDEKCYLGNVPNREY